MTQDFVTTLRLQLREAAEREARRGPLRRALPQARPLLLAAVVAAAVVVVALAIGTLGSPKPVPTTTAPHIVARLAIANQGGALSSGFGSLWTSDNSGVLRLGPDGGIVARNRIRGEIIDAVAGTGGMWALTEDRLYRIDPKTNRIVARIPLPPPSRSFTVVAPESGAVWVGTPDSVVQVDLRTNTLGRRVDLEHGGEAPRGFAAEPGLVYMLRRDGMLETLDARTMKRLTVARPETDGLPFAAARGQVVLRSGAGLAEIDASTGKLGWRTNLGTSRINGALFANGALWVQGTPTSGRDQLWKLDPRTGHVLAALPLSDFGVTGMVASGGRLWIMSQGGRLTAIR
jgi:putative pyrroloquinoline-quinone binding quinoprotein